MFEPRFVRRSRTRPYPEAWNWTGQTDSTLEISVELMYVSHLLIPFTRWTRSPAPSRIHAYPWQYLCMPLHISRSKGGTRPYAMSSARPDRSRERRQTNLVNQSPSTSSSSSTFTGFVRWLGVNQVFKLLGQKTMQNSWVTADNDPNMSCWAQVVWPWDAPYHHLSASMSLNDSISVLVASRG